MLKRRYASVQTVLCDLNDPTPLMDLGTFDVIHCYGILYHLENPAGMISYLGQACGQLAIVETCVSAEDASGVEMVSETSGDYTQSATGRGCRPTRRWVFEELSRSFPFVYHTRTQPNHPEFPIDWKTLANAPPLIRSVFVASKQRLDLPTLSPRLLNVQKRLDPKAYITTLEATLASHLGALREREQLIIRLHYEADKLRRQLERQAASIAVVQNAADDRLAALQEKSSLLSD